ADLFPRVQPTAERGDRSERLHLEFDVDLPADQVVDDRHVMTDGGEVQGCRPAAETVAAEHDDLHESLPVRPVTRIFPSGHHFIRPIWAMPGRAGEGCAEQIRGAQ